MKVYMDNMTNQIVTLDEADDRLMQDAQDFQWINALTTFSWEEIKEGLTEEFFNEVNDRFYEEYFLLRFTEYEIYGDESSEDENGEGDNRIWPPEDSNQDSESTETV